MSDSRLSRRRSPAVLPALGDALAEASAVGHRLLRRAMRRPAQHLLGLAFVAIAVVVAVNAAFLQPGPHPSPMFAGAPTAPEATAAAVDVADDVRRVDAGGPAAPAGAGIESLLEDPAAEVARPDPAGGAGTGNGDGAGLVADLQAALAEKGLYLGPRDGRLGTATVEAIEAFQRSRALPVTGEPTVDLLVALATGAPAARPEIMTVARVQAALNAKGFGPIAVDGLMGRNTGEAIRRFERARGLPETGEVSASLVRALGLSSDA